MIKITKIILLTTIGLFVNGCGSEMYLLKTPLKEEFFIYNTNLDEAFSKAIKAAADIGFGITMSDKTAGTFVASRGSGIVEVTEIQFSIENTGQFFSFILRVKSSKNQKKVIDEFINTYNKYVKIGGENKK